MQVCMKNSYTHRVHVCVSVHKSFIPGVGQVLAIHTAVVRGLHTLLMHVNVVVILGF